MSLDLTELIAGWDCPTDEVCARVIAGRDGAELVQMRIDTGLLQMYPDDRPDGTRYHGMASVLEFVSHETRAGRKLGEAHLEALDRELCQINYRRIALAKLSEDALRDQQIPMARAHLTRAVRDVETALECLRCLREARDKSEETLSLRPALILTRARLASQLSVVEQRYEDAVEDAETGARALRETLQGSAAEVETVDEDPGVSYLDELGQRLREQYGITMTLRERLAEALANEDFEAAARIRDEAARRQQSGAKHLPSPDP